MMELKAKLDQYSTPEPNTGCTLWIGAYRGEKNNAYGSVCYKGKAMAAHRASWLVYRGIIPVGLFVCHKCDTPLCINVDHLFLGTAKDNARDMSKKLRSRGQKKTHCPQGHPLSGLNLYLSPKTNVRGCKACRRKQCYDGLRRMRNSKNTYAKRSKHWNTVGEK